MNTKNAITIGLASGLILGCAGTGIAANQYVQALLNQNLKVSLNGQIQTFKDETTGEVQYPLTYNNRTYLPLRNVAQLSGLYVDYDSNTDTAILTSNNNEKVSCDYIEQDIENGVFTMYYSNDTDKVDLSGIIQEYYYYVKSGDDSSELTTYNEEKFKDVAKEVTGDSKLVDEFLQKYDLNETVGDARLLLEYDLLRNVKITENNKIFTVSGTAYDFERIFGVAWQDDSIDDIEEFENYCIDNNLVSPSYNFEYKVSVNSDFKYSKYKYLSAKTRIPETTIEDLTLEKCLEKYNEAKKAK